VPPFAICSNEHCPVYLDLYEEREGPTRLPPENCPNCSAPLLWFCRACSWPLDPLPIRPGPRCFHCHRRLLFKSTESFTTSNVDTKRPYALCSNSKCFFSIELGEGPGGLSSPTPGLCPRCESLMISTCPECGFLLMGNLGATICTVCGADIRRVFAKWHGRAQSA
jgi:hypothetical protein